MLASFRMLRLSMLEAGWREEEATEMDTRPPGSPPALFLAG